MAKICAGRQGNHFPFLMKPFFRGTIRTIGTRENVIKIMADVEALDPGIFERTFRGQTQRIVPHVILLPSFGDSGHCWEPFERFNRASSRGRLAVPMYPKDLFDALLTALADLRWQVAKEAAQHYWMEEGITGEYYQWMQSTKQRRDERESFIQDYKLWLFKESQGIQKLDREVRRIFWRLIPFPDEIRESLAKRGAIYRDLGKKDQVRSFSKGR